MLRRVSGPKKDEVIGSWRELHNDLHNLYFTPKITRTIKPNLIEEDKMDRVCTTHGGDEKCVQNFGWKA
jgi:hypothetical protein